ncbi:MAG: pyridoxal phosphate-dependent aminotransferase, partial [Bacteroidota bacterium]
QTSLPYFFWIEVYLYCTFFESSCSLVAVQSIFTWLKGPCAYPDHQSKKSFKMPKISTRGTQALDSPIRRLAAYADQAEADGKTVYYLNIGQPDIPTPQSALQAVRSADLSILKYSPSTGIDSYRKKLVEYYARFSIELDYTDLIITTGASEAISFVLSACMDPGEKVIVPEPFYANYLGFAHTTGVKIQPITSSIHNGFALPNIAAFEQLIGPKTKAIFLCNPSNPTGGIYGEEELRSLARLIKQHDLFLIVDEVYREFCYDGLDFFSVLRLDEIAEHTIVIDSISKRFSACGARIGSVVTKNQALLTTILKYGQIRLSPPTLGQLLGEATLALPTSYLDDIKAEYDKRRNLMINRLQAMPEVICYWPRGAFYAFVALPIDDADRFCRWLLETFSHQGQTIMLAPGTGFYATPGLGKQEVRLAYVINTTALSKAMDCLEAALAVYPHRRPIVPMPQKHSVEP